MGNGLSMKSRAEVTTRYAKAYVKSGKKDKGKVLGEVVSVTGWSRDNARRRLVAASKAPPGAGRQVAKPVRRQRAPKYSYDTVKVLQRVWAASGGQCGKYLVASMGLQLDLLEAHGELVDGLDRYSPVVRAELLTMSAASIDRYLAPARATDQIRGKSTTKPSLLLRSSIKIRKAGDEVEAEPGFFEGDTVAHCGPTLKGEFARTLNLTDVHTGWVFTRSVRNNAHVHILGALEAGVTEVPFAVTGLDFDNGTEFLNKAVIKWAGEREIFFTRSPAHLITALLRNSVPLSKSSPVTSNGTCSTPAFKAPRMWTCALLRTERVNTHPVWTSVRFRVRANSPFNVGPQWATVSPSKNPGSASTSSPALRILIEDRSSGEGFVVDTPRI